MLIMFHYHCLADYRIKCSFEITLETILHFSAVEHLLISLLATLFVYSAVYILYFPMTYLLWKNRLRTVAHFSLGMCPIMLLIFFKLFFLQKEPPTEEEEAAVFYGLSAVLMLTSVIHLLILKLYDKYIGIPEEPPRAKQLV